MNETMTHTKFVLPMTIVSAADLARLVHEIEAVDASMTTEAIHERVGAEAQAMSMLSPTLEEFLSSNQLALTDAKIRSELLHQMQLLKDAIPTVHMTFAVPADRGSLEELAQWLRTSVHPQAIIAVGLQPALVAGVYVRTANKVHDFSVRGLLHGQHGSLVGQLEALRGAK